MKISNQFTIAEAKKLAIAKHDDWNDGTELYMNGENWGEEEIGTMADWEAIIPVAESDAKYVGFYDWYISDHGRPDAPFAKTWTDYRNYLLTQLREIEIYDDDDEDD